MVETRLTCTDSLRYSSIWKEPPSWPGGTFPTPKLLTQKDSATSAAGSTCTAWVLKAGLASLHLRLLGLIRYLQYSSLKLS